MENRLSKIEGGQNPGDSDEREGSRYRANETSTEFRHSDSNEYMSDIECNEIFLAIDGAAMGDDIHHDLSDDDRAENVSLNGSNHQSEFGSEDAATSRTNMLGSRRNDLDCSWESVFTSDHFLERFLSSSFCSNQGLDSMHDGSRLPPLDIPVTMGALFTQQKRCHSTSCLSMDSKKMACSIRSCMEDSSNDSKHIYPHRTSSRFSL